METGYIWWDWLSRGNNKNLGFENVKSIEPEKVRTKSTLNFFQKHFHLAQRSVASKGYYETITCLLVMKKKW